VSDPARDTRTGGVGETPERHQRQSVYLAARYSRHPQMRRIRDSLTSVDVVVTSRWIDCHTDVEGDFTASFTSEFMSGYPQKCSPLARNDVEDVRLADTLISFTEGGGGRGGRHVEFGIALALDKRLIVIGPREHIFHTLPQVEWHPEGTDVLGLFRSPTADCMAVREIRGGHTHVCTRRMHPAIPTHLCVCEVSWADLPARSKATS
jgi:hypothetical protein